MPRREDAAVKGAGSEVPPPKDLKNTSLIPIFKPKCISRTFKHSTSFNHFSLYKT